MIIVSVWFFIYKNPDRNYGTNITGISVPGVNGKKEKTIKVADINIRNYAKYILRDGTILEKRELLACLRSKITLANKQIKII